MFRNLTKSKIFLYCCLALIMGVGVASFSTAPILKNNILWFSGAVMSAALVILGWRTTTIKIAALIALFLFLGVWRYGISLPADEPGKIWHYNNKEADVIGIVISEPDIRDSNIKYTIEVSKIKSPSLKKKGSISVSGNILVTANLYPAYNYGDELEIKCQLKRPEKFNGFDYDRYLARYNIYSACYYPKIKLLASARGNWFYGKIFLLKKILRGSINYGLAEPEASLAGPIIFGGQQGLSSDLRAKFSQTGLTHIMAVSGMNVSMLAAIVSVILFNIGFNRRQAFYLSVAFLVGYIILVGAPASAMRAGLMGFLVLWAIHLSRLYRLANSLALAAATMLLINPKLLRDDIGFQLSFLAILGIAYFYPFLDNWLEKIKIPKLKGARDILSITLAAQIFTAPIIAFNFSQISLIAPLANLLVLWTLPILTIIILIALPLGIFLPAAAFLFFFPGWLILKYIIIIVSRLSMLPYAYIKIDYLWSGWVMVYYIIAGLFIIRLANFRKQKI